MPPRTAHHHLRALVRTTTTALTPSLRTPPAQFARAYSRYSCRTPSPPPPYTRYPTFSATTVTATATAPWTATTASLTSTSTSPTAHSHWIHTRTTYALTSTRTFTSSHPRPFPPLPPSSSPHPTASSPPSSSPAAAQQIAATIEHITELYGTATDEFEIAAEETAKNTTYAPDDRAAAREELDKLLAYYEEVLGGGDRAVAEEVKRRVGGRIRELEQGVLAMEESALHGD
ncbi:hypothetical protein BDV95DRAFT_558546 [Massariosphaeria phaeospora]|uniref:Uncharacterized protein n=1 Tax=Massariosphaeria phaeospora TaxID=100035 RepID=A0A7C8IDU7_9PLEO|nr:hypothetical protein BDV95DRAFT_558546 [Massariosphaeria phaeospora]